MRYTPSMPWRSLRTTLLAAGQRLCPRTAPGSRTDRSGPTLRVWHVSIFSAPDFHFFHYLPNGKISGRGRLRPGWERSWRYRHPTTFSTYSLDNTQHQRALYLWQNQLGTIHIVIIYLKHTFHAWLRLRLDFLRLRLLRRALS